MPFNILILPLLGGFIFIHWCNRTKFKAIRLDKERLLFYAALAGIGLLALAFILEALIPPFIPCVTWFPCIPALPFDYIGVSMTALLLGLILPPLLNLKWKVDAESSRYISEEGDPFEQLINKALDSTKPVMLTLKGGKVYVGFVVSSFEPAREQRTIRIAPIKSGYREDTKLRVKFTTDYSVALEQITVDMTEISKEKEKAEEQLRQLEEALKAQELKQKSLSEGGEKNAKALAKSMADMAISTQQQAHLERVIQSQTEAIESLKASVEDFGIVVPIAEVTSVTLYSAQVHSQYFPHTELEE